MIHWHQEGNGRADLLIKIDDLLLRETHCEHTSTVDGVDTQYM